MKLLAIDPGYGRIGFAILTKDPSTKKEALIFSECFETGEGEGFDERVRMVGKRMKELLQEHKPRCVVIERLFFSKNKKNRLANRRSAWNVYLYCERCRFGGC